MNLLLPSCTELFFYSKCIFVATRFSESVHQNKKLLQVSFTYNRLTLRTEHQALDFINKHKAIPLLFPENHGNKELTKEK